MLRCLCTDRSDGPDIAGYDVDKGVTRRPLDEGESLATVELIIRATHDLGDRYPREGGRVVRHRGEQGAASSGQHEVYVKILITPEIV